MDKLSEGLGAVDLTSLLHNSQSGGSASSSGAASLSGGMSLPPTNGSSQTQHHNTQSDDVGNLLAAQGGQGMGQAISLTDLLNSAKQHQAQQPPPQQQQTSVGTAAAAASVGSPGSSGANSLTARLAALGSPGGLKQGGQGGSSLQQLSSPAPLQQQHQQLQQTTQQIYQQQAPPPQMAPPASVTGPTGAPPVSLMALLSSASNPAGDSRHQPGADARSPAPAPAAAPATSQPQGSPLSQVPGPTYFSGGQPQPPQSGPQRVLSDDGAVCLVCHDTAAPVYEVSLPDEANPAQVPGAYPICKVPRSAKYAPHGDVVAVSSRFICYVMKDATRVRVLSRNSGNRHLLDQVCGAGAAICHMRFGPVRGASVGARELLVIGMTDGRVVQVWLEEGEDGGISHAAVPQDFRTSSGQAVHYMAWSPTDPNVFAIGDQQGVTVFNPRLPPLALAGNPLQPVASSGCAFASPFCLLHAAGAFVQVWDLTTQRILFKWQATTDMGSTVELVEMLSPTLLLTTSRANTRWALWRLDFGEGSDKLRPILAKQTCAVAWKESELGLLGRVAVLRPRTAGDTHALIAFSPSGQRDSGRLFFAGVDLATGKLQKRSQAAGTAHVHAVSEFAGGSPGVSTPGATVCLVAAQSQVQGDAPIGENLAGGLDLFTVTSEAIFACPILPYASAFVTYVPVRDSHVHQSLPSVSRPGTAESASPQSNSGDVETVPEQKEDEFTPGVAAAAAAAHGDFGGAYSPERVSSDEEDSDSSEEESESDSSEADAGANPSSSSGGNHSDGEEPSPSDDALLEAGFDEIQAALSSHSSRPAGQGSFAPTTEADQEQTVAEPEETSDAQNAQNAAVANPPDVDFDISDEATTDEDLALTASLVVEVAPESAASSGAEGNASLADLDQEKPLHVQNKAAPGIAAALDGSQLENIVEAVVARHAKLAEQQQQVLLATVAQTLNATVAFHVQKQVQEQMAGLSDKLITGVKDAVLPALESQIATLVRQQRNAKVDPASLHEPLTQSFAAAFQSVLVPAFERASGDMLSQLSGAVERGVAARAGSEVAGADADASAVAPGLTLDDLLASCTSGDVVGAFKQAMESQQPLLLLELCAACEDAADLPGAGETVALFSDEPAVVLTFLAQVGLFKSFVDADVLPALGTRLQWLKEAALVLQPDDESINNIAQQILDQLVASLEDARTQKDVQLSTGHLREIRMVAQLVKGLSL